MAPIPRLSADDRRAQIIEAVTPAVLEHGVAVTTRQLAEAAGVAEGTLFKAFGDKESLLLALAEYHLTMEHAGDSDALTLDTLEEVVTCTLRVLVERTRFVVRLVMALGPIGQRAAASARADFEASKHRLAERLEPFRDELRVPPVVAADVVRTLAWAAASNWGEHDAVSPVEDILEVLLHGIVRGHASSPSTPIFAETTASAESQKV